MNDAMYVLVTQVGTLLGVGTTLHLAVFSGALCLFKSIELLASTEC